MKNSFQKFWAFTLVELVVAITISSIIFLWVLSLVWDTLHELGVSNSSSKLIVSLSEVIHKFEALNSSYEKKSLFVDKPDWKGTDILVLSSSGASGWTIIALVDPRSKKIYNSSTSYPLYNEKHIWYRKLNQAELASVLADSAEVYNLDFFTDKIFSEIYVRDFQIVLYNSGTIADIRMSLLLQYWKESEWIPWEDVWSDKLFNINLNF